ncbi:hypothetical protein GCM10009430_39560 [Aquimarina litoralis]|uniref:MG2 domain-containing protein n=1 Tax=Aquimarina litoralis TaxID=584605 RepID=A0ABP3UFG4_9FLAO
MKNITFLLLFIVSTITSQQKKKLQNDDEVLKYKLIPQETLFLHYNNTLLFSGENLHYKIYCFNSEDNAYTNISKVAYVVLLNEDEQYIFKHRIQLNDGIGYGDFFIPVSVPSGNYKIVAYTQWMLNAKNHFYQGELSIINPYQVNENIIAKNGILPNTNTGEQGDTKVYTSDDKIRLSFDKTAYACREKVTLTLENQFEDYEGSYSISVIRKDTFVKSTDLSAIDFVKNKDEQIVLKKDVNVNSSVFLPEMRGELVYGKIKAKEDKKVSLKKDLGLSLPKEKNEVYFVSTDDAGEFVLNLPNRNTDNDKLLVEVLGEDRSDYTVSLYDIPKIDFNNLNFYQFKITSGLKDKIIQRSVYNQIENNYYGAKPDTLITKEQSAPFYGKYDIYTYKLDEYTRFPTIKETLVEVVEGMWSTKDENGKYIFGIRDYYPDQEEIGYKPLLLIDGVVEQDQDKIINSAAKDFVSISYIRDRYYLGSKIFGGIVLMETKNNDYAETRVAEYIATADLPEIKVQNKKYFKQKYNGEKLYDRIPDYRNQLLWEPEITFETKKKIIRFFTSDIKGEFEVRLEGFNSLGVPVSVKKSFLVD